MAKVDQIIKLLKGCEISDQNIVVRAIFLKDLYKYLKWHNIITQGHLADCLLSPWPHS